MSDSTIRVVRFAETGDASVLKIFDEERPEPGPGELRIKVEAIGLNRAEVMFRNGAYIEQPTLPSKLGYEASGTVLAVGEGVKGFAVGDKVSSIPAFSQSQYGVYASEAIVPEHALTHLPENLSFQQGAALWMQYLTAFGALVDVGQLRRDQSVLITAASSSVGIATIQLAKHIGAKIIATTRGASKVDELSQLGADYVIQTDNENLVEKVQEYTAGKGADLIFDPIAGPILDDLAQAAAAGGTIIEYGALASDHTPFPLFPVLAKQLTVQGYTLFQITQNPDALARGVDFIKGALASNSFSPVLDKTFKLDEIRDAHRYMESNQQIGKIIVTV